MRKLGLRTKRWLFFTAKKTECVHVMASDNYGWRLKCYHITVAMLQFSALACHVFFAWWRIHATHLTKWWLLCVWVLPCGGYMYVYYICRLSVSNEVECSNAGMPSLSRLQHIRFISLWNKIKYFRECKDRSFALIVEKDPIFLTTNKFQFAFAMLMISFV